MNDNALAETTDEMLAMLDMLAFHGMSETFFASLNYSEIITFANVARVRDRARLARQIMLLWAANDPDWQEHEDAILLDWNIDQNDVEAVYA